MIRIMNVHKLLSGRPILRGVDLEVHTGEVVALVGASGAGKSVLLRHVVGLLDPDDGDIEIDGESIVTADARQLGRIRRRMGFVFQDAALLDSLTVRENLRLALDDRECRRNPMYAADRMAYALEMVRLPAHALDRLPSELSGGMRKRAGVARAVINSPDILLHDEPTTGLDPLNVSAINELIIRSRDTLGATSLVVTHDMTSLPIIADRIAFLHEGRVAFTGSPAEFAATPHPAITAFMLRQSGNVAPFPPPVYAKGGSYDGVQ
jgi:phospholipid/cholesterol/gamma-HCH transport system ATP-binding protein